MKSLKHIIPFLFVAVLIAAGSIQASVTKDEPVNEAKLVNYDLFASTTLETLTATTTSATSTDITPYFDTNGKYVDGTIDLRGAEKATFYFSRGGATSANTGSTRFEVEVTPDGTNWYDFNKLVQNTATSTSEWMVANVTISAATSTTIVSLDLKDHAFYKARCIAIETTDGEHRCRATVQY